MIPNIAVQTLLQLERGKHYEDVSELHNTIRVVPWLLQNHDDFILGTEFFFTSPTVISQIQ